MTRVPYGYYQCGCGQRTTIAPQSHTAKGYIKGQPRRFIVGHNHGNGPTSLVEYVVDPDSGCWVWQRATSGGGYAVGRGRRAAHRAFYEERHGPIPEGMQLDHLCRNRACVNPDHLEPVTAAENQRRGDKAKLTEEQVRQIKVRSGWVSQKRLAELYSVDQSTISLIISGKRWGDIDVAV